MAALDLTDDQADWEILRLSVGGDSFVLAGDLRYAVLRAAFERHIAGALYELVDVTDDLSPSLKGMKRRTYRLTAAGTARRDDLAGRGMPPNSQVP